MELKHMNKELAIRYAMEYRHFLAMYSATGSYGNIEAANRYKDILCNHGLTIEDVEYETAAFIQATTTN